MRNKVPAIFLALILSQVASLALAQDLSGELVDMQGIGFQQFKESSRVFVRTTEPVKYRVDTSREGLLVLILENTRVPLFNNQRYLDTRFFSSPVRYIKPTVVEGPPPRTNRNHLSDKVPFQPCKTHYSAGDRLQAAVSPQSMRREQVEACPRAPKRWARGYVTSCRTPISRQKTLISPRLLSLGWMMFFFVALTSAIAAAQSAPQIESSTPTCTEMRFFADSAECELNQCRLSQNAQVQCGELTLWAEDILVLWDDNHTFAGATARKNVMMVDGNKVITCQDVTLGADRVRGKISDATLRIGAGVSQGKIVDRAQGHLAT
ncbi:MAG: hypothetical protein R3C68_18615 [Myxococcota bacterium]